jgi:hypothetical protein
MWSSQAFIYLYYMMYGLYMYSFQGQYVQNPSYLGLSLYKWSTVRNILAMMHCAYCSCTLWKHWPQR